MIERENSAGERRILLESRNHVKTAASICTGVRWHSRKGVCERIVLRLVVSNSNARLGCETRRPIWEAETAGQSVLAGPRAGLQMAESSGHAEGDEVWRPR